MSSYEENIPVDKDAEHRSRLLLEQYKDKLIISGKSYPDPFSLEEGWESEIKGSGLSKWPSLYYTDIEKFLFRLNTADDLLRRLDCDYKEGKSYRYFKCNFVKEIFYHEISPASEYCFLRCRVTPSMRFSNAAYYVWAAVKKDNVQPGGHIENAYCTCTAGLLGCCNHTIAMMFRIEAAVSTGVTKPSCTSLLSKWNVPTGSRTVLVHRPISEMVFTQHDYTSSNNKGKRQEEAKKKFSQFLTCDKKQEEFLKNTNIARNFLYQQIKDIAPQSCFVEMVEKKRKSLTTKPKTTLPLGIKEQAGIYKVDTNISQQDNIINFTRSILLNKNEIKIIEAHTKEQSKTDLWYKQRIGRITASKVHSVVTRMETLIKTESTDAHNLVGSLLHSKPF